MYVSNSKSVASLGPCAKMRFVISLKIILPVAFELLSSSGEMVCLIKPQFEAGRENVGKKGVVRERSVHIDVVKMIIDFALSINFDVKGLTFSPVKGPEGNIEYLIYLKNGSGELEIKEIYLG